MEKTMEYHSFWKSFRRFRLKSVFVHYYTYILLLAFLISALFSVYIYHTHIQHLRNSREMALSAFLTQSTEESDNSIRLLYETILSISRDPLIAKAIVAPSMKNSQRNAEIAQKLNSSAMNFDYINRIYLYESTRDMLFTSDEKLIRKNASAYRQLIDRFLSGPDSFFDESFRQKAALISEGGSLYLVCRFIPASDDYLGLIAAELNTSKLFSSISQTLRQTNYFMSVRMPDGTLLFDSGGSEDVPSKSLTMMKMRSGLTNWEYTIFSDAVSDSSLGTYLRSILPFLISMLLFSLLFSFLVTGYVYSPIRKLLLLVENEDGKIPEKEQAAFQDASEKQTNFSELDFLSSKYTKLASDNRAAETFIREVRPELESKLILDIIHKNLNVTEESLQSQIGILNSALDPGGCYQCYKVKLSPLEQGEQLVYYMVYHQTVRRLTDLLLENSDYIYFLYFHDETFSFTVQYGPGRSDAEIRAIQHFLANELKEQFGDVSEEVLIASGQVRSGLQGLSESYYEAKAELKKLIYYGQDIPAAEMPGSSFDMHLERIRKALAEDHPEDVPHLAGQLLDELCVPETDPALLHRYCSGLADILLERIYAFPAGGSAEDISGYRSLYEQIEQHKDAHLLNLFMKEQVDILTGRLLSEVNKRQNKIIAGAKEYIEINYADSSLSIHDIAEAVGITDTYLSSIFTEYTGENLVTCLNRYRVDMAKELLINTNIIIKDIGFKTGFYTIQNFNRVFKRFTGSTPGDYRKQNK